MSVTRQQAALVPHGRRPRRRTRRVEPVGVGGADQRPAHGARSISSSTVVSASSRPRPMTTRWSAVTAISLIRWLETSTVRPSAARSLQQRPHPQDAVGVEAVDRLVEDDHGRVAEQRRRRCPAAVPCRGRTPPARRRATVGQADQLEDLVDPRRRDAVGPGQRQQVVAGGAALVDGPGLEQRADLAQRGGVRRVRRPLTVAAPLVGRSRPTIIRMVVDFPAPFGPRNPVT